MAKNTKTPAMVLQEFCVKKGIPPPNYEIIHCLMGTHENRFDYRVTVSGFQAEGTGTSKQISKHQAAQKMLTKLREMGMMNNSPDIPMQEFTAPLQNNAPESPFRTVPNCIGPLKDLCIEHKIPDPKFILISDVGMPHSKEFTFECSVASLKTEATGNTKKMAKQLAAKEMLERIKHVLPEIVANCSQREDLLAITDIDNHALNKYNQLFGKIVPDKTVTVEYFSHTLKKLMIENDKTIENFSEDLAERSEPALKRILGKLGLEYNTYHMQDDPTIVSLNITTDTPFVTMGVSSSEDQALAEAIENAFEIMDVFMRL